MPKIVVFGDLNVSPVDIEIDEKLREICNSADVVVANLEGPIVVGEEKETIKRNPRYNTTKIRSFLSDLSVNVLTLANNHIYDYGESGLGNTIKFCVDTGVSWVGARTEAGVGNYLYIDEKHKIAIFAFAHQEGPVAGIDDKLPGPFRLPPNDYLDSRIKRLKEQDCTVLIFYHGGEEYFNTPWPRRLGWCARMAAAGADLVIGTHSHSVQPVYFVEPGAHIAPGLGNTYFDRKSQKRRNKNARDSICLVYDTETKKLDVHNLYADFEGNALITKDRREVILMTAGGKNACRLWIAESVQYLTGRLNAIRGNDPLWKRIIRPSYLIFRYIIKFLHGELNQRDLDIFRSVMPFARNRAYVQQYKEGYEDFRF